MATPAAAWLRLIKTAGRHRVAKLHQPRLPPHGKDPEKAGDDKVTRMGVVQARKLVFLIRSTEKSRAGRLDLSPKSTTREFYRIFHGRS
jgi:hypothetical protein